MNELSQLLYWGNVAGHLGGMLIFLGVVCLIAGAALQVGHWVVCSNLIDAVKWNRIDQPEAKKYSGWYKGTRFAPLFIVLVIIFGLSACFMPDRDTVYAIAASELGNQVIHTKTGSLAEQALDAWLQKQISLATNPPPQNTDH